jgi:poly-gamma-glutamate synthesis protein (capsule biosynthesis protein)
MDEQNKSFTLVATGDSLIFQKISIFQEPNFLKVKEIIKQADAAFNNFETIIPGENAVPRYKTDPTAWMRSPQYVLDELLWMGFNLFSLANNHSMDYSKEGLIETKKNFDERGVTNAGTGKTLSEARAAAYLNTEKGRVALLATNTREEDVPAADSRGTVPGRPGVNPMRGKKKVFLTDNEFRKMVEISKKLDLPEPQNGKLKFLETEIELQDCNELYTEPYTPDLEGNIYHIKKAKENADYVFVSIHNHEKLRPGKMYFDDTIEYISTFVEDFCREAVDAGADAILGHGTHCLNGIEIYKGKPIFYGLGNFIAQNYQANPKPYDWYEARGLHRSTFPDETVGSLYPPLDPEAENRRQIRLSTSFITIIIFENHKLKEVLLYPIEMNRKSVQGGRPYLAHGDSALEILNRLSRLSREYGTEILMEGEVGRIKI